MSGNRSRDSGVVPTTRVFRGTAGLWFLAAEGFAAGGHFAWLTVLIFAVCVVTVALRPAPVTRRSAPG